MIIISIYLSTYEHNRYVDNGECFYIEPPQQDTPTSPTGTPGRTLPPIPTGVYPATADTETSRQPRPQHPSSPPAAPMDVRTTRRHSSSAYQAALNPGVTSRSVAAASSRPRRPHVADIFPAAGPRQMQQLEGMNGPQPTPVQRQYQTEVARF